MLQSLAKEQGGEVSSEKLGEKEYKVTIKMQGVPAAADAEVVCAPDQKGDLIVVVSSDRMGTW